MQNLEQWAAKWGVPYQAIYELRQQWGMIDTDPTPIREDEQPRSEAWVTNQVRLEASKKGARIWRNNVGATKDEHGNFIRYGLCNDSKRMNQSIKSSDLIGIKPVMITQAHVGTIIGQFIAREVKMQNWEYVGSDHEQAQLKFIELVNSLGGNAAFCNKPGTI